jgi:hypothetical protein
MAEEGLARPEQPMDRAEIEIKLHADRAWLVQHFIDMPEDDRMRPATPSENDPSVHWSGQDHLVHLAGIEGNFNRMIRRGLEGQSNPVGLMTDTSGRERTREEIMAGVHKMNEDWVERYRGRSLSDVLALGQSVRADTLKLLSELSDEQVTQVVPGAPWASGVIGGILMVNGDHARQHLRWVKDGWAAAAKG